MAGGWGGGGRPGWWGETRYLNLKGALPQWESLPTDRHTDEPRQAQSKQKRKDAREISQMMPRSAVKPRPSPLPPAHPHPPLRRLPQSHPCFVVVFIFSLSY